MKKTYTTVFLPLSALLLLAGCSVSEKATGDGDFPLGEVIFRGVAEDDAPSTRTSLANDLSVLWSPGDEINIFYGSSLSKKFTSTNSEEAASADFKGDLTGIEYTPGGKFLALYPYSSDNTSDGNSVSFTLPSSQTSLPGSFSRKQFPSMAVTTERDLYFKNICGGIRLSFTRDDISSVKFSGRSKEALSGKLSVEMSSEGIPAIKGVPSPVTTITLTPESGTAFLPGKYYYIVAIPGTLSEGYEITLYTTGGKKATKQNSSSVTIKRGIWGTLTGVDSALSFEDVTLEEDKSGFFGLGGKNMTYTVNESQLIHSYADGSLTFTLFNPTLGQFVRVSGIPENAQVGDSFTVTFLQNIVTSIDASYKVKASVVQDEDPSYTKIVCEDDTVITIKK